MLIKILKGGFDMLIVPILILLCCCCCLCCSNVISIFININKTNNLNKKFSIDKIKNYLEKNYFKFCVNYPSSKKPFKCKIKNKNYEINKNVNGCITLQKNMIKDTKLNIKCEGSKPTPWYDKFEGSDLTKDNNMIKNVAKDLYKKKIKKNEWVNHLIYDLHMPGEKKS